MKEPDKKIKQEEKAGGASTYGKGILFCLFGDFLLVYRGLMTVLNVFNKAYFIGYLYETFFVNKSL